MSIDDILLYLAETGKAHYLILLEEEDGYSTVYRPMDQPTKLSCALLTAAVKTELEISSEIHTFESIQ